MTTSLDVSRKLEQISIDLLIAVDSTATAMGITYTVVGAFARDVVLGLCFGINTGEATRDIDFALMMDDWAQFNDLRSRLVAQPGFVEHKDSAHRLTFRGVRQLDIVPFGGIERKPGEIAWPPEFTTVMSTVGLRQVNVRATRITIAEGTSVPFASPAALGKGSTESMRPCWTKQPSISARPAHAFSDEMWRVSQILRHVSAW